MKEKIQKGKVKKIKFSAFPKQEILEMKEENLAGAICEDINCNIHGTLKARGRTFEGSVIKKSYKRIMIEFERMIYVKKYERYKKSKTKIHARLPKCMENEINIGDYVKVQECRPLSKLIHFIVIEKIRGGEKK